MSGQNFQAAFDLCTGIGARLCSLDELSTDETSGTGCGYDNTRVWSSTLCGDGHMTAAGNPNSWGTHPPACSADSEGLTVRCCADEEVAVTCADVPYEEPTCSSPASCADLGWGGAGSPVRRTDTRGGGGG